MKSACIFLGSLLLAAMISIAAGAQQPLDNNAIAKMAQAGLSDDIIVQMIATQPGSYKVAPDALVALKKDGVSERVLGAMVARASGAPVAANAGDPPLVPAAPATSEYEALDVGVYQKVNHAWVPLSTERVNWKSGGVLKNLATDGIVKGDINGRLNGPGSPTALHTPLEFLIKAPDGAEATDYELVHLHDKSNAREFRTITGGVFHSSGGASKDAVGFEQKSVGRRAYMVTFTAPPAAGEYAFLAPGVSGSTASGSTGKAYTFHLLE